MADYITTDEDLLDSGFVTEHVKARLTPPEWRERGAGGAGPWQPWHTEAWSEIKRQLAKRADPIEEDDLTDSSELQPAAIHYVLYLAFLAGSDKERSQMHFDLYHRMLGSIDPTVSSDGGSTSGSAWGYGIELGRR